MTDRDTARSRRHQAQRALIGWWWGCGEGGGPPQGAGRGGWGPPTGGGPSANQCTVMAVCGQGSWVQGLAVVVVVRGEGRGGHQLRS
ncbi:hypothetical protein ACOMHN_051966 [Nucella lapillus]